MKGKVHNISKFLDRRVYKGCTTLKSNLLILYTVNAWYCGWSKFLRLMFGNVMEHMAGLGTCHGFSGCRNRVCAMPDVWIMSYNVVVRLCSVMESWKMVSCVSRGFGGLSRSCEIVICCKRRSHHLLHCSLWKVVSVNSCVVYDLEGKFVLVIFGDEMQFGHGRGSHYIGMDMALYVITLVICGKGAGVTH